MSAPLRGRALSGGEAEGTVIALAPLSFWGGYDATAGRVTDRSHPGLGASLRGVVLVMTAGRGSSSSSSVLAEAIRLGTGPAAIVLAEPDAILAVGALVAGALYGRRVPVVVLRPADHARAAAFGRARVRAAGDEGEVAPAGITRPRDGPASPDDGEGWKDPRAALRPGG